MTQFYCLCEHKCVCDYDEDDNDSKNNNNDGNHNRNNNNNDDDDDSNSSSSSSSSNDKKDTNVCVPILGGQYWTGIGFQQQPKPANKQTIQDKCNIHISCDPEYINDLLKETYP